QGGILQGAGTVTGNVTNGGTVAPGLSPGILNIAGNYVQTAGGTLSIEINGIAVGTQYDQLNVTGTITLAGTLAVSSGFVSTPGNTFIIGNNNLADAVSGTFNGFSEGTTFVAAPNTYQITYAGGTGNDIVLTSLSGAPTSTPTNTATNTPTLTPTPTPTNTPTNKPRPTPPRPPP